MGANNQNIGSGGVATQVGIGYQNRVAAWMCVRILAEQDASPLWELKTDATFDYIRCETGQPVDDILVGTSEGGHAFINVKHAVKTSRKADSALCSVINQFVRQFISYRGNIKGHRPWERQLNIDYDRLVLVTSPKSSIAIKEHLPHALAHLRELPPRGGINAAIVNLEEQKILTVIREHIARAWRDLVGSDVTEEEELQLLRFFWVETLDVGDDKSGERDAKDLLRAVIINDPTQADVAWVALVTACAGYASRQSGADRTLLQQELLKAGIRVKAPGSYL